MDDGGNEEGGELGHEAVVPEGGEEAPQVNIDIVVEPVVHHDVPLTVVGAELDGVPPVGVEGAVGEARDLGPQVEPAVEEAEEAEHEEEDGGQHELDDSEQKGAEVEFLLEVGDVLLAADEVEDEG